MLKMYYNAKTNEILPTCNLQINENPVLQVDLSLPDVARV